MQLNDIKKASSRKNSIRVGRGGKRGKTSGRGQKGQKARAGTSGRPAIRDIIKKLPKLRGQGKNGNKNKAIINKHFAINLSQIEAVYSDGEKVNTQTLFEKGLIEKVRGRLPWVKILANGDITKKIEVEGLKTSKTAKEKIEKAGGKVTE